MKYEQIRMQFEEICEIIVDLSDDFEKEDLNLSNNHDRFLVKFSEVVCDKDRFLKLMEISAMSAKDILVVVLAYTGCEVKQLVKPMTRELKKALKSREIR